MVSISSIWTAVLSFKLKEPKLYFIDFFSPPFEIFGALTSGKVPEPILPLNL
jgi:hypothetical protein